MNVIKFNKKESEQFRQQPTPPKIDRLAPIQAAFEQVAQSLGSRSLIQGGYCGEALKREMANAQNLEVHIVNLGKVIQGCIIKELTEKEGR
jgi:hypothetical protein